MIPARSSDHGAAFLDVVTQGFFDIDILAGLTGKHGGDGMPVIRRADDHGINIFLLQQFSEVFIGTSSGARPLLGRSRVDIVHIADRAELHVGNITHQFSYVSTSAAAANQPDAECIVAAGMDAVVATVPAACITPLINSRRFICGKSPPAARWEEADGTRCGRSPHCGTCARILRRYKHRRSGWYRASSS